ncbi:MAG: RNA methyltransferase [Defluviitaleaceae bacterium]|nr:RNA methyltransferase [Defluviitaleaceae bacterium]
MATCVPGLEAVLLDEIYSVCANINNAEIFKGKVIFDCAGNGLQNKTIYCADNLYKLHGMFEIGAQKKDLPALAKQAASFDFSPNEKQALMPGVSSFFPAQELRRSSFLAQELRRSSCIQHDASFLLVVSAVRSGKHNYSRHDIADEVSRSLISTGRYAAGDSSRHDLALRVEASGNICKVYSQLTSASVRFRGTELTTAPGGIRPTVAHALVRISGPDKCDVFYDPFCGAGTIAHERAFYGHKKIYASDIDADMVETAKKNLNGRAVVFAADAVKTKMKDGSVDKIVSNIPWGKQIAVDNIENLYKNFFAEVKRILKPGGSAVILTDKINLAQVYLSQIGLECTRLHSLSLHGLHPGVYMIRNN